MKEIKEEVGTTLAMKETYKDFETIEFPKLKQVFLNIKESPYHVGDHRTLLKGIEVFSIDLQSSISFNEDQIIEVTGNTWNGDHFFFKLKDVLGLAYVPYLIDKGTGELSTSFSKTTDFIMPKSLFFNYK